ncbi:hypothetical protein IHC87_06805 [Photobacterium damselae subsp. damselae]|uniref:hypothetical protein n=1 Tax=Photobacterium damselae TaxID=38293 RepID=UPI001F21C9D5|nr:hypothetical protein [Photobacterium damselae]UJZ95049.1 hypothetical protein IHC87_06805 [Photobacterium damselae subsp. damselae]UJZ99030.1 hypothetical protein IHC88_06795 [Photobacterium damselae subsp. damselae]
MSKFSSRVEFDLSSIVASGMDALIRNIAVKKGVTGITMGQVVIIKTTGAEPWDGTAEGKLGIATKSQLEDQTTIPCLVIGCYTSEKVNVAGTPITTAQKLTLMSSTLFEG